MDDSENIPLDDSDFEDDYLDWLDEEEDETQEETPIDLNLHEQEQEKSNY